MRNWLQGKRTAFGLGLSAGLLVGAGMLVGCLVTMQWKSEAPQVQMVQASGGAAGEYFAMAVGRIDEQTEGVYFLDYLTGQLECRVLNARTGRLGGVFKHNVIADLGVDKAKKASYVLMGADVAFRGGRGSGSRPAGSVVYVLDENTGNYACYGLSWNSTMAASGRPQAGSLTILDKGRVREAGIKE